MKLNETVSERVVVDTTSSPWVASPAKLVQRKPLEREGGEVGRATSVVRYEAGARFPSHAHPGGEELFVIDGALSDEHGTYDAGTYLANPPGSRHEPYSESGCTLFVKLGRLHSADRKRVVVPTRSAIWHPGSAAGLTVLPLSEFESGASALVDWAPGTVFRAHRHRGGEEIFVLSGVFEDEHGRYPAGTWIRSPHMSQHHPFSREGCRIFVKTGHLLPSA